MTRPGGQDDEYAEVAETPWLCRQELAPVFTLAD